VGIYGNGGGLGALDNGLLTLNFRPDLTVASAALITCENGKTMKLWGDIGGAGETLTLDGRAAVGGSFNLAGQNSSYAKKLIVTNSTVTISGNLLNITNIWVDAGGVLEGLQAQFPLATVVETNGGVWIQTLSATWTGAGDGSNWTDTANWTPQIVPIHTATIPDLGPLPSTVVVVDSPTHVNTLVLANDVDVRVRLDADLTVGNLDADHPPYIEMNGHTLTIREDVGHTYMPSFTGGGGRFVKIGPGSCYSPNTSYGYTGDYIISNGLFVIGGGLAGQGGSTNMTVHDGATVEIRNDGVTAFPSNVVIHGDGGTADGVIRNANKQNLYPDITVASDALIVNAASLTFTLHGDIEGPGELTFGANATSTNDLNGTFNFASSGTSGNKLIISSGTLNIQDCTLSVGNSLKGKLGEQVVIDRSTGTLTGTFLTNDVPSRWELDYDGTSENPNCVVLVPPVAGGVLELR